MKPEELRIKNYVNPINRKGEVHLPNTGIVLEIVALKIDGIDFILEGEILAQTQHKSIEYYNISPIKLTEAWLLKLNFEDWGTKEGWDGQEAKRFVLHNVVDGTSNFEVWIWDDGEIEFRLDDEVIYVRETNYIHNLQNVYYLFTGNELCLI